MAKSKKNARKTVRRGGKLSQAVRRQIRPAGREDMPSHAFLIPGEKKYPIKVQDPKTGRWVLDANLLLAAQKRAVTQRRPGLASKARAMRLRLTGEKA